MENNAPEKALNINTHHDIVPFRMGNMKMVNKWEYVEQYGHAYIIGRNIKQ